MNAETLQTIRKTCQCGHPVRTGIVQKEGPNKGKRWEACGNLMGFKKEEGGCGYFKMYLNDVISSNIQHILDYESSQRTETKEAHARMDLYGGIVQLLDRLEKLTNAVDELIGKMEQILKREIALAEKGYQTEDERPPSKRRRMEDTTDITPSETKRVQ
ncbi:MAG: hypothetical protein QW303_01450 [Nitrososphaerota archaeon]